MTDDDDTDDKDKEYLIPENFSEKVSHASVEIMIRALELTDMDPIAATAALTIAAGRAAGFSSLPMGQLLNIFSTQYFFAKEDGEDIAKKKNFEESLKTPSPVKGGEN